MPGVNTGFGGSANTRTKKVHDLQSGVVRELRSGVLPVVDNHTPSPWLLSHHAMPFHWVRAAMLIRINSLISGHSGVRSVVVEQMLHLLRIDAIPQVPMHGSISASGDLMPLGYIAAAVQGSADSPCTLGGLQGSQQTISAKEVFHRSKRAPQPFSAKEALAVVNGTAVSCAVACLALHEIHGLAVLSQILTAMSVEALKGSMESFDPVFAQVRPHLGQVEAARNIRSFLSGSRLTDTARRADSGTLHQDRYSVRTTPQWIGPVLEDLLLAHGQLSVECNSVTDNPIIDIEEESRYLSGGNFQAKAVTSAMEKARQSLQSLGRMIFSQVTELLNPAYSCGLPPNLVIDEPNESFLFKSVDMMAAALTSELGFLANPVGSHVQNAEMGNQSLNSLALISARYTMTAVDIASKLMAAHLLVVCQAIDIRIITFKYFEALNPHIDDIVESWYKMLGRNPPVEPGTSGSPQTQLHERVTIQIQKAFESSTVSNSGERFIHIAESLLPILLSHSDTAAASLQRTSSSPAETTSSWISQTSRLLQQTYYRTRDTYLARPDAAPFLGPGSRVMWTYIRETLQVPVLRTAVLTRVHEGEVAQAPSFGAFTTTIYNAIRSGAVEEPLRECLSAVEEKGEEVVRAKL